MKRFSILVVAILALFAATPVVASAQSSTTASFNGCVYHTETYAQAVDAWIADGYPTCGPGYSPSVSVDVTVGGTVEEPAGDTGDDGDSDRSSWGRSSWGKRTY
jgi:hypothetical protein